MQENKIYLSHKSHHMTKKCCLKWYVHDGCLYYRLVGVNIKTHCRLCLHCYSKCLITSLFIHEWVNTHLTAIFVSILCWSSSLVNWARVANIESTCKGSHEHNLKTGSWLLLLCCTSAGHPICVLPMLYIDTVAKVQVTCEHVNMWTCVLIHGPPSPTYLERCTQTYTAPSPVLKEQLSAALKSYAIVKQ